MSDYKLKLSSWERGVLVWLLEDYRINSKRLKTKEGRDAYRNELNTIEDLEGRLENMINQKRGGRND